MGLTLSEDGEFGVRVMVKVARRSSGSNVYYIRSGIKIPTKRFHIADLGLTKYLRRTCDGETLRYHGRSNGFLGLRHSPSVA